MNGHRTALVLAALAAVVAALAASASATTSPTNYRIFTVRLTNSGVSFTPKAQLEVGEVGLFRITNASKAPRVFAVSTRATHLLKSKGKESFYEIFPTLGKVKWTSHASKGKTFSGYLRIVPCKNVNGTSSCNGTA